MKVTYLGSRIHIAQTLADIEVIEPLVVIDAVTLNREELVEKIEIAASASTRLLIRPEIINEDLSGSATEYLSWIDAVQSKICEFGETRILNLPRQVEDWKEDIKQVVKYHSLVLIEPAKVMSLVSREQAAESLRGAVAAAASGADIPASTVFGAVPTDRVIEILSSELGYRVGLEPAKPSDLFDAMIDAGMNPTLSSRVIGAQQLVVSDSVTAVGTYEALTEFKKYVRKTVSEGR
ncbi:hypothetical protein SAMN04488539_1391 [Corynebacterium timonense]|uniref:Uncharacterized protein n=2 Tax=Corynebacterium timonense TaxID=441500 RepID=A0A1H1R1U6_9CORY|nr:hypothetical protein [Corynebacterium timonense]SDS29718.1 hypothetical protein SAMN04488539_1391 [Corynebacterium timonense]